MRKNTRTDRLTPEELATQAILASDMETLADVRVRDCIGPGPILDMVGACDRGDGSVLSVMGITRDNLNMMVLWAAMCRSYDFPDSLIFADLRGAQ